MQNAMKSVFRVVIIDLLILALVNWIASCAARYTVENLEVYVAEDCVYVVTPQGEIHEYDYVEWDGDM